MAAVASNPVKRNSILEFFEQLFSPQLQPIVDSLAFVNYFFIQDLNSGSEIFFLLPLTNSWSISTSLPSCVSSFTLFFFFVFGIESLNTENKVTALNPRKRNFFRELVLLTWLSIIKY